MDCRTDESCNQKRNLGFRLHDVINTNEETVINSIKDAFSIKDSVLLVARLIFTFININLQLKLMN